MIEEICSSLVGYGYSVKFYGFSALDTYLRLPAMPFTWIETNADIAALARLVDNLRFPGVEMADCAVDIANGSAAGSANGSDTGTCYFRCLDSNEKDHGCENDEPAFPLLSLTYDWRTKRFYDPLGVYPLLRKIRDKKDFFLKEDGTLSESKGRSFTSAAPYHRTAQSLNTEQATNSRCRIIMVGALLLARYANYAEIARNIKNVIFDELAAVQGKSLPLGPEMQRVFLISLLVSPNPEEGLELLKRTGFLDEFWPELASYSDVDHSKEYHPEGNVWNHTLETFRYRKAQSSGGFDLRLSLALLLHDAGKPISASFGNHRFDGHAELGARAAARFLERLDFSSFSPSIIEDIYYLVKNHMLPAALKRLPLTKTAEIMASPLFPTLMELYRCDESSSFKGLDEYYQNSAAYQTFLKNLKNPFRSADGKKIGRKELYRCFAR